MPRKRIKRYQKIKKTYVTVIFFSFVFLYMMVSIFQYLSKEKISIYEVYAGSISTDSVFTGIALREEMVYTSDYAGNINYFLREGSRAAVGSIVYTVDETGRVADMIASLSAEDNAMSSANLSIVRNAMTNYKKEYDDENFYKLYDLKSRLSSTVADSVNENIINNLDDIIKNTASDNLFKMIRADKTGIVVYYTDGYEDKTVETLKESDFIRENYVQTNLRTDAIAVQGSPVYKQLTSEDWSIVIKLTDQTIKDYGLADKKQVRFRFVKEDITTYANFEIVTTAFGTYGKLSLSKYMIQFVNERFVDIELILSAEDGLKIPTSAVISMDFYLIPVEYAILGMDENDFYVNNADGTRKRLTDEEVTELMENRLLKNSKVSVLCESSGKDGSVTTQTINSSIYAIIGGMVYVDQRDFNPGDRIIKMDSTDRYIISDSAVLEGVYCVNLGYAVFRRIERIDQNLEYVIIRNNTKYGLSTYDHIILNGSTVSPDQIIY